MTDERRDYLVLALGILTAYDGASRGELTVGDFTATANAAVEDAVEPGQLITAMAALARTAVHLAARASGEPPEQVLQQLAATVARVEDGGPPTSPPPSS